jgi:Tol biopolymer transport system component
MRRADYFDVWIVELARGTSVRLTTGGFYQNPVWTPDGTHVVFTRGTTGELYWVHTDGGSKPESLLSGLSGGETANSWTPDGKTLLYQSTAPSRNWALQPVYSGGNGKPRPVFETSSFNESEAQVSRDGRWVAYISDESGKNRVYVRPFPGYGAKTQISIEAGVQPRWSRDGRELYYRDPERNQLMAVPIQSGSEFRAGSPSALFELGDVLWDAAPDGRRFLVVNKPETSAREGEMQVVVNWFEEIRQKVQKK